MWSGRWAGGVLLLLAGAPGLAAQDVDRIWGRVETVRGEVHEGFIRWDRNEGSWTDLLDGSKAIPRAHYRLWMRALDGEEAERTRTIELLGFRISWEEDDPEFPRWSEAGIRFGHLRELRVTGDDAALLLLRNGEEVELERGSTDLGTDMRELLVDVPGRETVDVSWRELDRITFGPMPGTAPVGAPRLHGTAEDRWGNRYTGYISWDRDEILADDILDGDEGRTEREIPFGRIAAVERDWEGARVTLTDGREMVLSGSNDVGRGHRGVQVSDPGLGMVDIPWDEFETLRFHEPDRSTSWDDFDGGHRLHGTVTTRWGDTFEGTILWDADEGWSWETLDGYFRDVAFDVEFGLIDRIERASSGSARVTLLDGRILELEDSNDVSDGNKGIFVAPAGVAPGIPLDEVDWILVPWDDLDAVRFRHD